MTPYDPQTAEDLDVSSMREEITRALGLDLDISVMADIWLPFAGEEGEKLHNTVHALLWTALESAQKKLLPSAVHNRTVEISLVLANDDLIQTLNREYRQIDKPTNVLSFATLESGQPFGQDRACVPLGDIVLSFETIAQEAIQQNKPFADHFSHMIVHGALHLLGYDHIDEHEAIVMEGLEIEILKSIGVKNPYSDQPFSPPSF